MVVGDTEGDHHEHARLERLPEAAGLDDRGDREGGARSGEGYRTLVASRATSGALDAKTRELVALAVAVTVRCDGCIATHVELARTHGESADEITDALGVAIMVNAGATLVYSARTIDAFHAGATETAGAGTVT
jgi:AhpD family alkylhydroperoxidase